MMNVPEIHKKRSKKSILDVTILLGPLLALLLGIVFCFNRFLKEIYSIKGPYIYRYQGEDGIYLLKAEKILISLLKRELLLEDVDLYKEEYYHGKFIFKKPILESICYVKKLKFNFSDPQIQVHLSKAWLSTTKAVEGLSIAQVMPKLKPSKRPTAFLITLDCLAATLSKPVPPIPQLNSVQKLQLNFKDIRGEFFGDRWLVKGDLYHKLSSKIPVRVDQWSPGYIRVRSMLNHYPIGGLWPDVKNFFKSDLPKDLLGIDFREGVLTGELKIEYPRDLHSKIYGDITGLFSSVSYKNSFLADRVETQSIFRGHSCLAKCRASERNEFVRTEGILDWSGPLAFEGSVHGHVQNPHAVASLKNILPVDTTFSGMNLSGQVKIDASGFLSQGLISANSVSYKEAKFSNVKACFEADSAKLLVEILKANYLKIRPRGRFEYGFSDHSLQGVFYTDEFSLGSLLESQFGLGLEGSMRMAANLRGTSQNPCLDFESSGAMSYSSKSSQAGNVDRIKIGDFNFRFSFHDHILELLRGKLVGDLGTMVAKGSYDFPSDDLNIECSASDAQLADFAAHLASQFKGSQLETLAGRPHVHLSVKGSAKSPKTSGFFEIHDLKYQDFLSGSLFACFDVKDQKIRISDLYFPFEGGEIGGCLEYDLGSKALSGSVAAHNLLPKMWIGDHASGIFSLDALRFERTSKGFLASGTIRSKSFNLYGLPIHELEFPFQLKENAATLGPAFAKVGDGVLELNSDYVPSSKFLDGKLGFKKIPFKLLPVPEDLIELDGHFDGAIWFKISKEGVKEICSGFALQDMIMNQHHFGGGSLSISYIDGVWKTFGALGTLERTAMMDDSWYNPKTGEFDATFYADRIAISDLVKLSHRQIDKLPEDLKRVILSLRGDMNGVAFAKGSIYDPEVNVPDFKITDLNVAHREAGAAYLKFSRKAKVWDVDKCTWEKGDSAFNVQGQVVEDGNLSLKGALKDFDLSWVPSIYPKAPLVSGKLNSQFSLSGVTQDPEAVANLVVEDLAHHDPEKGLRPIPLKVNAETVEYKNGKLSTEGKWSYGVLKGTLVGHCPIGMIKKQPEKRSNGPLSFLLTLDQKKLSEILSRDEEKRAFNLDKTEGNVDAWLEIRRKEGEDALTTEGSLELSDGSVAFNALDTSFEDINLVASISKKGMDCSGVAQSSLGGLVSLELGMDRPLEGFRQMESLWDLLLFTKLSGKLKFLDSRFATKLAGENSHVDVVLKGGLDISGPLLAPVISGSVDLDSLDLSFFQKLGEVQLEPWLNSRINLVFDDIKFKTGDQAKFASILSMSGYKAVKMELALSAEGVLRGTLNRPELQTTVVLDKGKILLPTGRIELTEESRASINYQLDQAALPLFSSDLNLKGKTFITARSPSGKYERYEIDLGITGDLYVPEGLNFSASSEPNDLSQTEILSHLISGGFLNTVLNSFGPNSQSSSSNNSDDRLTFASAIKGFALPYIFNYLTEGVAPKLGLDYFAVDFDPERQIFLTFGKSLGAGFFIRALGTLHSLTPGPESTKGVEDYELQITYRLPTRNKFLGKTTAGISFSRQEGEKLTIDYGRRF